ncbi:MAG: adenylate kinase family protein [Thermoplasmata archaeon]
MVSKAAITGTPGVGKTSVSQILKKEGFRILDLNKFIHDKGLSRERDPCRDTYMVDIDEMIDLYSTAPYHDIVEGHLSHHLELPITIVLRCSPQQLKKRMKSKGWSEKKKKENLESEMLDVILIEALEKDTEVYEIDTSYMNPEDVSQSVIDVLGGKTCPYEPGNVDWSEFIVQN